MAEEQDVDTLKRRGRRRLIGAIALVLLAVIVLPMVFDPEPKTSAPSVQIRIPGEGEGGFTPKGPRAAAPAEQLRGTDPSTASAPPSAVMPGESGTPEQGKSAAAAEPARTPAPPVESAKMPPKPSENKRAETARRTSGYIVPVAAFSSAEKLKELAATLQSAKLPYYTEPIATAKGPVTRVRAGPFANREAAERARDKLRGLGLKPGNALAREG